MLNRPISTCVYTGIGLLRVAIFAFTWQGVKKEWTPKVVYRLPNMSRVGLTNSHENQCLLSNGLNETVTRRTRPTSVHTSTGHSRDAAGTIIHLEGRVEPRAVDVRIGNEMYVKPSAFHDPWKQKPAFHNDYSDTNKVKDKYWPLFKRFK